MMEFEIIKTKDGFDTVINKTLNATYHSTFGSVQESSHVFIEAGLKWALNKFEGDLSVLEIGFGSGLNAILTLNEAENYKRNIFYHSIELFPLPKEIYLQLNLLQVNTDLFLRLHECSWNEEVQISSCLKLYKILNNATTYNLFHKFHCIYLDAFDPEINPELWSEELFLKLYESMHESACLVTYCAKGKLKRLLKEIGFKVETLKGAIGKREMIRAIKI